MLRLIKKIVLSIAGEFVWLIYSAIILLIVPVVVRCKKNGKPPPLPSVLCVMHVGNFDPLFVVRATRRYRTKAVYQVDGPYPFLRFLYWSFWRFRVSQDPSIKESLNKRTTSDAVAYLQRKRTIMVYPEGYWNWKRRLYAGVAVIAHRANVPLIPVGIENGAVFDPDLDHLPPLKAARRVIREYSRRKWVRVHFGSPITPNPHLEEKDDVNRIMTMVETEFTDFYRRFYNEKGPIWLPEQHGVCTKDQDT